jgi:hypothetical protein
MDPAEDGTPRSDRDHEARPLAEIYGELAAALLRVGEELSAAGDTIQAEERFAEAAQAFTSAIREGGSLQRLGLGLAHAQERQGRHQEALRTYLDMVRAEPARAPEILPMAHRTAIGLSSRRPWPPLIDSWRCRLCPVAGVVAYQPVDRPALDLIGRPRLLISGSISRAGARTCGGRGSVGAFTRRPTRSRPRSADLRAVLPPSAVADYRVI